MADWISELTDDELMEAIEKSVALQDWPITRRLNAELEIRTVPKNSPSTQ